MNLNQVGGKSKRTQKGGGAACSSKMFMPEDPECSRRIAELNEMREWMETVLRIMDFQEDNPFGTYFNQGISMLKSPQAIKLIVSNDELFKKVMDKKQELMLMIHAMITAALEGGNNDVNGLFTNAPPQTTIPLTYAPVESLGEQGCETCPITLDDIMPGNAVKISHTLEDGRMFSICLSKGIFDEPSIKTAMETGKTFMKHPLLREKAYIDLNEVKRILSPPGQQSAGAKPKRTDKKITIAGRQRTVYVGKHNKQYVQINRQFVAVSSLASHKKTRK
jgi:hypothetical protein